MIPSFEARPDDRHLNCHPVDLKAARTLNPAAGGQPKRARILLVEDEGSFRELVQAFLEAEGFEVRSVGDGRRGAQWLGANQVDVVVTDLCMPNADGMEFLIELRRVRSSIPVIVMSGGVGGEMAGMLRAAELLGARCTLAKPFPLQQLATAVRKLLPAVP